MVNIEVCKTQRVEVGLDRPAVYITNNKVETKTYGEMELNLQGVVSENIYGVAVIEEEEI